MWPRSGSDAIGGAGYGMVAMRQSKSGGLNGFVSYMKSVFFSSFVGTFFGTSLTGVFWG